MRPRWRGSAQSTAAWVNRVDTKELRGQEEAPTIARLGRQTEIAQAVGNTRYQIGFVAVKNWARGSSPREGKFLVIGIARTLLYLRYHSAVMPLPAPRRDNEA